MLKQKNIFNFIKKNKEYLRQELNIEKIGIFGSFARGDQKKTSDIDLIVEFTGDISDIYEKKEALRNFFYKKFHRKIDIVREKYLKPYIKDDILEEVRYVA